MSQQLPGNPVAAVWRIRDDRFIYIYIHATIYICALLDVTGCVYSLTQLCMKPVIRIRIRINHTYMNHSISCIYIYIFNVIIRIIIYIYVHL